MCVSQDNIRTCIHTTYAYIRRRYISRTVHFPLPAVPLSCASPALAMDNKYSSVCITKPESNSSSNRLPYMLSPPVPLPWVKSPTHTHTYIYIYIYINDIPSLFMSLHFLLAVRQEGQAILYYIILYHIVNHHSRGTYGEATQHTTHIHTSPPSPPPPLTSLTHEVRNNTMEGRPLIMQWCLSITSHASLTRTQTTEVLDSFGTNCFEKFHFNPFWLYRIID